MVSHSLFKCIDAGTENCPCYLAACNNCLTCSKLQGKECSQCDWKGVCIFNEFVQNGRKVKNIRKEKKVRIVSKKAYQQDTFVFQLEVGKGMAMKCMVPGTFVLLRNINFGEYYSAPISIMLSKPEKGIIHVAVKRLSAKTNAIIEAEEEMFVKGPYKNGLFGLENINDAISGKYSNHAEGGKFLIVSKGIGIAPTSKLAHFLEGKAAYQILLDTAKVGDEIVEDYLGDCTGKLEYVDLLKLGKERFDDLISSKEYDMIAIFASDYYISVLGKIVREKSPNSKLLVSNNFNICCGEGVCGACSIAGSQGETIKMCKCQLSGEDIVERSRIYT